jgi:excinuclease ABC subunit C
MTEALQKKLEALPSEPGVYLMKNAAGQVIYVGKATNLSRRVRSYFEGRGDERMLLPFLEREVADIDFIVVRNEKAALLLEAELIKQHQPRFNVKLKGGERWVYLRLDPRPAYPRLEVTRTVKDDGARYFGPYVAARALRETLQLVNRYFQLRTCSDHDPREHKERPCLLCQIARFPEPSVYDIPPDVYQRHVKDAILFLEGKKPELIDSLRRRMEESAAALRFEEAARLRDKITAVERTLEPGPSPFGRGWPEGPGEERPEQLTAALQRLQERLRLRRFPYRIECFDVSHFHGEMIVASKVAMTGGQLDKDRYRRYKIKTVPVGDDYAAMHEVVARRLRRGLEEHDSPDLIVLDGGPLQLAAAQAAMEEFGISDLDVSALAKIREVGPREERVQLPERIYVPGQREAIVLPQDAPELLLLVRLRDEAHRFALTYQKKLLERERLRSELDCVPGIGPKRKQALLRRFESVERIRQASAKDLAETEGVGLEMAQRIYQCLRDRSSSAHEDTDKERNPAPHELPGDGYGTRSDHR